MQKNALIVGAGIVIVLAGILLFVRAPQAPAPVLPSPEANPAPVAETPAPASPPPQALAPNPPPPAPAPAPPPSPPPGNTTITVTDAGFSPATITIKKGTTVVFKNQGSGNAWPASDPHPTHTEYPAQGGCAASTFDACRGISPGESWSFTFAILGTWAYHDHRNPLREGTIIVE